MLPEGYREVLEALIELGIRNASESARQRLARECAERRVDPRDIHLAFDVAVQIDGKSRADAARIVAAQLASSDTWVAYVQSRREVMRTGGESPKASEHEHGKHLRKTPSQIRQSDYRSCGLSESDARLVEIGGYVHARIVGDDFGLRDDHTRHRPGEKMQGISDIANEVGLDPWTAIQAAAWWSDLFGDRRATLLRAMVQHVKAQRCSESLLEHLYAVGERQVDKEKPEPILSGWRAKVRRTRRMEPEAAVYGEAST